MAAFVAMDKPATVTYAAAAPPAYCIVDLGIVVADAAIEPAAINAAGQVVGTILYNDGSAHPFLWQSGGWIYLGSPLGQYSVARAINKHGQVVGSTQALDGGCRAWLWDNGKKTELGTPGPGQSAFATGINDAGQIVGGRLCDCTRALPRPDGVETSLALGVNARGDVVGYVMGDRFGPSAVRWRGDVLTDLNAELQPDSGWVLEYASAINNAGQIVGVGRRDGARGAFLLTPLSTRAW
jgi:probable HAF family extracellular repeat protein